MVFDQIAKAASSGHGLTLQPLEVDELMDALLEANAGTTELQRCLVMASQIIEAVLMKDPDLELTQEEVMAAQTGFWMRNDDGVIRFGLGEPEAEVEAELVE